jgi:hypothetical protein
MIDRRQAAVAMAFLILLSVGGCRVDSGSSTGTADVKVFDLTSPPSRATAGLAEGKTQFTFQQDDHKPFPIQVKLPGAKMLAFDAKLVGFDSLRAAEPASGPPTSMDVQFYAPTLEAGRDHLATALRDFGLDPAAAQTWYDEADALRAAGKVDQTSTPWVSTKLGYLDVQLQGGYASSGGGADQTVVHYLFSWAVT